MNTQNTVSVGTAPGRIASPRVLRDSTRPNTPARSSTDRNEGWPLNALAARITSPSCCTSHTASGSTHPAPESDTGAGVPRHSRSAFRRSDAPAPHASTYARTTSRPGRRSPESARHSVAADTPHTLAIAS